MRHQAIGWRCSQAILTEQECNMSKSVLHMNIDSALKQELQRQADAANRSLSNHVETLLLNLVNSQPKETVK